MRKRKMKKMYEGIIAEHEKNNQDLLEICKLNFDSIFRLFDHLGTAYKQVELGKLCGRWVSAHNPRISATLYLHNEVLNVLIYKGRSIQSATTVVEEKEGLCMLCCGTAVMLPVRYFDQLDGLMLGEYGLFRREEYPPALPGFQVEECIFDQPVN